MLKLHTLKVTKNSRKRRKVVGRGLGSGHGTYSGRGAKGQKARKSGTVRPGFEGGRQPLIRQLPKLRGFKSHHPKAFAVRISMLNVFADGETITADALRAKKLAPKEGPVKIVLGGTALKKKLIVQVPSSATAKAAIEKLGGKAK